MSLAEEEEDAVAEELAVVVVDPVEVGEFVLVCVSDTLPELDAVALVLDVSDTDAVAEEVSEAVADTVVEAVTELVTELEELALADPELDPVFELVTVTVCEDVLEAAPVAEEDRVAEEDGEFFDVIVIIGVLVTVIVDDLVGRILKEPDELPVEDLVADDVCDVETELLMELLGFELAEGAIVNV